MTGTTLKVVKSKYRLVNVTNDIAIKRVRHDVATRMVATGEWRFCPKKFVIQAVS